MFRGGPNIHILGQLYILKKVSTIPSGLDCSCLLGDLCQTFELWSQRVQKVKIVIVAKLTAAPYRAGSRAHPLIPIAVDDVLREACVVFISQIGQLLQDQREGQRKHVRKILHHAITKLEGYEQRSDIALKTNIWPIQRSSEILKFNWGYYHGSENKII